MDDWNFTEGADHEEIGKSLEGESLTNRLVLDCLRRTFACNDVLDYGICMSVHCPE